MIKAVVTDIEGTTSALSFVKDVLFPYARARLAAFVRDRTTDPAVRAQLDAVRALAADTATDDDAIRTLLRWSDEDRKLTPLKALQGMIWEEGYRQGAFVPQLYGDVLPVLTQWRTHGIRLGIYSSGSEQAQRLLFAHTNVGDVTSLFEHFFDTTVGEKKTSSSYRKISDQIGLPPPDILFLSDAELELDAAASIGFRTAHIVRPGTDASTRHPIHPDLTLLPPAE